MQGTGCFITGAKDNGNQRDAESISVVCPQTNLNQPGRRLTLCGT
jgi:hypothetical protein